MRIAQVAPLYESVPPKLYGGTERVVSYLTEELVDQGHEVTLFASGDSRTNARLISPCPRALRLDTRCHDSLAAHMLLLDDAFGRMDEFDVVHFHVDYLHFPFSRRQRVPHVTTLHGRLDLCELKPLYQRFGGVPLVSISNDQRAPIPAANWLATVYHGLPGNLYHFRAQPGEYLAFLGRISPEKRVDRAIEIARRCSIDLKIAAKVDKQDREYFEAEIRPLLNQSGVEFIGEIDEAGKSDLLGNALALLFPIDWPEPFGLVVIESLACGTPVIAWRRGSIPEIIHDGVTGFICQDVDEAATVVERVAELDRRGCRREFEDRFHVTRMAEDYVRCYERLTSTKDALNNGRDHSDPRPLLHPGSFVAGERAQPCA